MDTHSFGFRWLRSARFGSCSAVVILALAGTGLVEFARGQVITEFPMPTPGIGDPAGIAAGPNGNLWFTEYTDNRIGRITMFRRFVLSAALVLAPPAPNPLDLITLSVAAGAAILVNDKQFH